MKLRGRPFTGFGRGRPILPLPLERVKNGDRGRVGCCWPGKGAGMAAVGAGAGRRSWHEGGSGNSCVNVCG